MEKENALHLLQFWFAVESFKNAVSAYDSPNHMTVATSTQSRVSITNRSAIGHVTTVGDSSDTGVSKQCNNVSGIDTRESSMCSHMTVDDRSQASACSGGGEGDTYKKADVAQVPPPSRLTTCTSHCQPGASDEYEAHYHEGSCGKSITKGVASVSKEGHASQKGTPDGMIVNQRLLKQLSLSKDVCVATLCAC